MDEVEKNKLQVYMLEGREKDASGGRVERHDGIANDR